MQPSEKSDHKLESTSSAPICLPHSFERDPHFRAIAEFYGDTRAERSGVPYINHIREGLHVLDAISGTLAAKQAYCLHPLFQGDKELASQSPHKIEALERWPLLLAMEYRKTANAYLSNREIKSPEEIRLSPLPEVQQMLIADKVQNRKDFDLYHLGSHPRSAELQQYFQNWFLRLGISEEFYQRMVAELKSQP